MSNGSAWCDFTEPLLLFYAFMIMQWAYYKLLVGGASSPYLFHICNFWVHIILDAHWDVLFLFWLQVVVEMILGLLCD